MSREEIRRYSEDRLEEARRWRKLAEQASQRARLHEDAAREAHDLAKIRPEYMPPTSALSEMIKIQNRFKHRLEMLENLTLPGVDPETIQGLWDWLNNHTNSTGGGSLSPPADIIDKVTILCPR